MIIKFQIPSTKLQRSIKLQAPIKLLRWNVAGALLFLVVILTGFVQGALINWAGAAGTNSMDASYQWTGKEWPNGDGSTLTNVPVYTYNIINTRPHDYAAFTEGLTFCNGILLEGTGLIGQSNLRKVDLQTGQVIKQVNLPPQIFGEGVTVLGGKIYELTWQQHVGFVYDYDRLSKETNFFFAGEGWGLTTDGQSLIMSDGTPQIRFLDPKTFSVTRTITVSSHGRAVKCLNELEYVDGKIFANIWQTDYVARIDPATGEVIGLIDFSGLLSAQDRTANTDVLNGIAYDAAGQRLFVTGKRWPKLFEVQLQLKP